MALNVTVGSVAPFSPWLEEMLVRECHWLVGSQVLGESMAGISQNAKTGDLPAFGECVGIASKALCGLTEAAAQVRDWPPGPLMQAFQPEGLCPVPLSYAQVRTPGVPHPCGRHGEAPTAAPSPTTITETMGKVEVPVLAGAFRQSTSQLPPRSTAAW